MAEHKTDPWLDQKNKISTFYAKVYEVLGLVQKKIDWSEITLPEYSKEFSVLEYIDRSITGRQWIAAYKRLFDSNIISSVCGNDYSDDIEKMIKEQQLRPEGSYCVSHMGGINPDASHLNKQYGDFCNDGNNYLIPIEGIIAAARYRFETNDDLLDVESRTCFHSLNLRGRTLFMMCDGVGKFYLGADERFLGPGIFGPRQCFL